MNKNILIIDEHEDIVNHLADFHCTNLHCIRKSYGERAIKLMVKQKFDLVILARCLPDIDGLEVLKIIRLKHPEIPVIFVAASPTFELALSAFRLGAVDFFKRPIEWQEFDNKLFDIININEKKNKENQKFLKKSGSSKSGILFSFINDLIFEKNWLKWLCKIKANKISDELPSDDEKIEENPIDLPQTSENQEELLIEKEMPQSSIKEEYEQVFLPTIKVSFLGKFSVLVNERSIGHWPSRKVKNLFAYLAYNHKKRIYRDILMDKFWLNHDPDSARNCLNVAIHSLRKVLNEIDSNKDFVLHKDECYFLNPEIEVWIDIEEFLQHWRVAQSSEREQEIIAALSYYELAAALYKGEFMEEDLYGNWQESEREYFKEIYLVILDRISNYYSLDGKPDIAINLCNQILEKDNCREDVHQRIMRCFYRIGKRDKALKQYQKCVEILKSELDVPPMQATIEMYKKIRQDNLKI